MEFEKNEKNNSFKLEIINNNNKKIKIEVNRPQKLAFLKASNPFDDEARSFYFSNLKFKEDHKSGYLPITFQTKQVKELEEFEKEKKKEKKHMIRRKQSACNIKRTCGVSYIKPSESQQKEVNEIYEKLTPLIFQCSTECEKLQGLLNEYCLIFFNFFKKIFLCIFNLIL